METATEVLERLGPRAALSHEEAARRHGIELVDDRGTVSVTVPRNHSRTKVPGWRIVRADLAPGDYVVVAGATLTRPLRTVADLARTLPLGRAVAAADSSLRHKLLTVPELAGLGAATGRGAAHLRAVSAMVDPGSGSVLESLLRVLLATAGVAAPTSQYEVHNDFSRVIATVDFCWPLARLIVEADGFAFHSNRKAYRADRVRMNELQVLGWRVLRFTWEDVMKRPAYIVSMVTSCLATSGSAPAAGHW